MDKQRNIIIISAGVSEGTSGVPLAAIVKGVEVNFKFIFAVIIRLRRFSCLRRFQVFDKN